MTKDGAMKIALEGAANYIDVLGGDSRKYRQVLAQPEQEPWCMRMNGCKTKCEDCPVEVAQPEQDTVQRLSALVRAQQITIDKLEAQPEQEPVAWYIREKDVATTDGEWAEKNLDMCEPLYTSPPQRTWVGLSDEEVDDLSREMVKGKKSVNWLSYSIEAKLKEKNTP